MTDMFFGALCDSPKEVQLLQPDNHKFVVCRIASWSLLMVYALANVPNYHRAQVSSVIDLVG
jgi:hypothetical protein